MASPSSTMVPPSALEVPYVVPGLAVNTLIGGLTALGLYGFFCALFGITIHVLCFRRKTKRINYVLLVASLLIFVLTTLDVVLQCNRLLLGLLFTPPGLSPDAYFSGSGTWTYALQLSALMTNILVADAVLLYRVWVVWGKRWPFIVVNSILWCAVLGSTIRVIQLEVEGVRNPLDFANLLMLDHWAVVVPALSLGHTVLATGLIAVRLFQVERTVSAYTRKSLFPVMRIVVESGAIYAILMLVETVTLATSSAASLLFSQLIPPAIGITFALIVCRVGLAISDSAPLPHSNGPYPSKSVNVSVKRTVDTHEAYDSPSVMEEGDDTLELKGLGPTGSHSTVY
ncbi:hypothetical protein CALVIDRAFT_378428 [Calocera viscosa TUFC12733]|uniref:Uncharacterized protein n=1 Tax=Calocera viscosa (strain TUFC12733) TaxID=1330018 RepID=A0A167Q2F2_CALVF|nr:hypothetical protein CALVIDRAFT_378428 [Calocera viscosa TUFC12733]